MKDIESNLLSSDFNLIEDALFWIAENKPQNALNQIVPFINHENESIRETVMICLGEIKNPMALPYLINSFKNDLSEKVRYCALSSMIDYNDKSVLEIVLGVIKDSNNSNQIRNEAFLIAGRYNTEELRSILIEAAVKNDNTLYTLTIILESLFKMNQKSILPFWKNFGEKTDNRYFYLLSQRAIFEFEAKYNSKGFSLENLTQFDDVDIAVELYRITIVPDDNIFYQLINLLSQNQLKGRYAYGIVSLNMLIAMIILEKGKSQVIKKMINTIQDRWTYQEAEVLLNHIESTNLGAVYKKNL